MLCSTSTLESSMMTTQTILIFGITHITDVMLIVSIYSEYVKTGLLSFTLKYKSKIKHNKIRKTKKKTKKKQKKH
jgi:hypothetical protein